MNSKTVEQSPGKPSGVASPRRQRLDALLRQAEAIILTRQDATTGLLPASTAITVHGDYTHAWVRDNVYSILAVWGLALAYRRDDPAQAERLEARVVALMRGLLAAMMKQAAKVERFKVTRGPLDALHAKYDTRAGEPVVGDEEWGHLQLDATAIFVLMLAQMSAAGARIVTSRDEVDFIQNLAWYLADAWRTPDYGIWERGHKRNEGVAEVNASSLGMAKAALEAIRGFAPLGAQAPAVHVPNDAIAKARETLAHLLPRESLSKETDAALLAVIGFPAYAVEDADLVARTRAEIVTKLQGRYGCKRFLRDGHQTVLEDHGRLHYEPGELARFTDIESEWPLFFSYFLLDAALAGDSATATEYRERLATLTETRDGQHLLPELYFVPAEFVAAEKARPHSQPRVANANVPLVWAQSLYLLGLLVNEDFVAPGELDPLGRRLLVGSSASPRVGVGLLAEDAVTAARLKAAGVNAEVLDGEHAVTVQPAAALARAFTSLGANAALGLTGRPPARLGTLATSRAFTGAGKTQVFLPEFLAAHDFYRALDNRLLVERIRAEIAWLAHHWREPGEPLLVLQLTGSMLDAPGADALLAYLGTLGAGEGEGVRVAPLAELLTEAAREAIDWPVSTAGAGQPAQRAADRALPEWEEAATRPLTAARAAAWRHEPDSEVLLKQLQRSRNPYEQIELLEVLGERHGMSFSTGPEGSLAERVAAIYEVACRVRRWGVLRHAAALLGRTDATLEDAVAELVGRGKRIAVGRSWSEEAVIAQPMGNAEIQRRIEEFGADDPRSRVLVQEIVLALATLIKGEPALLAGTLTLRAWHLLLFITAWLAREHDVTQDEAFDHLLELSPHALLGRLREVISREQEMRGNLARVQSLYHVGIPGELVHVTFPPSGDPELPEGVAAWERWREASGVLTRVPEDFYARVWELLDRGRGLTIGDQLDSRNRLESALWQADTTPMEATFALQVEDLLNRIHAPEYRQLSIETLTALSDITRANPDLAIDGYVVLDVVIGTAVRLAWLAAHPELTAEDYRDDQVPQAWMAFYALPPHAVANQVMAAVAALLMAREAAPPPGEAVDVDKAAA